jgi:signal transduction histidine kinase
MNQSETPPTKFNRTGLFNLRQWTLELQLTVFVSVIVLLVVGSVTVIFVLRQNQTLQNQMEERAVTTLISIDAATIDELYFSDVDRIETIVENIAQTEDILNIRIYDASGRLLVGTDDRGTEGLLEADPFGTQLIQSNGVQLEWENERLIATEPVTVGNQVLGGIYLELSTADLNRELQVGLLQGFIIAVVSGILGVVTALIVSHSLTTPIASLVEQTQSIGGGNFTQSIQIQGGSSEITELGTKIEEMRKNLQEIYADLETRVAQRTVELKEARDEAIAAQRLAQESARLKSEFLSTMSHELRTPMNAIEGFTSIMLKRMAGVEYNAKTERYLTKVQSNSRRLLNLINDFLDISRIESGRLELAHLPMFPREMAERWHENLSVLSDEKNLNFEVHVAPDLPETIYGDEEAFSKIAINLVGNAIKFTETGRVSLKLEKRENQIALIVEDTGIGIPPHAREFIFDEFRQVDQSSTRQYGGTGLGLAIVQKFVRAMNGTVALQSEVGVGSTFTVLLPIQSQEQSV